MRTELANTTTQGVTVLDGLAMQARALRLSINVNLWQLAKVFIDAKELVPHGEWEQWLQENADVSVRTAQDMMNAYRKFGENPQFTSLGQAKIFKLLPLPAGTEEKFMEEHDVASMTTREIQEAVKKAREEAKNEAQAEIDRERNARIAAEKRAEEAENAPPAIPEAMLNELRTNRDLMEQQKTEIERLSEIGRESISEKAILTQENSRLQREIRERDELLAEQQEDLSRAQQELLNVQSAIAKGDAERVPADQLTADAFAGAVRVFIGAVARMPHMRGTFAVMAMDEKRTYDELLSTVERWAKDSRKALDSTRSEGTVI